MSLRDKILREMIGNLLVHREFSSSRPARFIIESDKIVADNASKALKCGAITLENLSPVSKNPIIARFFKQMGRADELGSGTRNLYRYSRLYSNADPILEEGDTFTAIVPLDDSYSTDDSSIKSADATRVPNEGINGGNEGINEGINGGNEGINEGIKEKGYELVVACPGINAPALAERLGKSLATAERIVSELVKMGRIEHRGSKKTGGYYVK